MSQVRAAWRLLRLALHLLGGLWTLKQRFPQMDATQQRAEVKAWSARALQLLGVQLRVLGDWPAGGPLLVLCNHVSWLDILVLNAAYPCRFVSKADVRHWPVIGRLVEASGTLFIEREKRRDAMRVVHHMAEHLARGEVLAVFPEGTTGSGEALLPFHANLLQAAVVTNAPVLPTALSYLDAASAQRSHAPVYVGEMTLLASLWRTASQKGLQACLHTGLPELAMGRDRRTWARGVRSEIERLLSV